MIERILIQVKEVLERIKSENDFEQGISETELALLWIELQTSKNPMYKGFSKHPW